MGTPSGHPTKISHNRSLIVCSSGGQPTAGLTMLTTQIHTPTYGAHFIVPSQTRSAGTKNMTYHYQERVLEIYQTNRVEWAGSLKIYREGHHHGIHYQVLQIIEK